MRITFCIYKIYFTKKVCVKKNLLWAEFSLLFSREISCKWTHDQCWAIPCHRTHDAYFEAFISLFWRKRLVPLVLLFIIACFYCVYIYQFVFLLCRVHNDSEIWVVFLFTAVVCHLPYSVHIAKCCSSGVLRTSKL